MWTGTPPGMIIAKWEQYIKRETRDRTNLQTATRTTRGSTAQADIDTKHTIILTAGRRVTEAWSRSLVEEDPYAQPGTIENAMDAPNKSYTGYFNMARLGQTRVHKVDSQGHTQEHKIYDTTKISPSFHTTPMISAQGTIAIATNDAKVSSLVRTIRPWEALSLFGFTKEDSRKLLFEEKLSWRETKEPKSAPMRQLQRAVVPPRLRATIIAAYHASPMAGHVGFHKTYYRIAARFWWPGMAKDIREAVLGCGHCNAANASSHKNQKILQQTPIEEPFDVCCMDVWSPGSTKNATKLSTTLRKTLTNKGVVTYVCNMIGCATVAFISSMNSGNMARIAFLQFFTVRGLPRLILIDEGSKNKDQFTALCNTIGIAYHTVSPENHDRILCERFHKYLNKVQQIGAADMNTYEEWAMNTMFGTCAWNAAPVDGTDIQRAFAAVARHFKFPIDNAAAALSISEARQKKQDTTPANAGTEHIRAHQDNVPTFWRQKELLKLLNEERREHQQRLKNQTRTRRKFALGDILMVRKQVQSNASAGIPAKLVLRTKGPYRVIEKASEDLYRLQKIPGTSTMLTKARIDPNQRISIQNAQDPINDSTTQTSGHTRYKTSKHEEPASTQPPGNESRTS
ncbi:unnamed protein product [Cylindrotheca closterium]|uniref:Integrase catalytic domain-containing protein n=1 Tax=Cylindrotheca closterium TaxID=2856 RepID=A0AAD2FZP9_9STRA|nr:unnamed protein product [Cylindrotheca closterium]